MQKTEKTEGATGLGRINKRADRKMEPNDILRFQKRWRHQRRPASLRAKTTEEFKVKRGF